MAESEFRERHQPRPFSSIENHALLSDRHSAALVTAEGVVDWLCFPRFDSPSVFGSLLDEKAGFWSVRPVDSAEVHRAYIPGTMVMRTTFRTARGELDLIDALVLGPGTDPHRMGEHAPHTLVRQAHCRSGHVDVAMRFQPRPEYGLVTPRVTSVEGGAAVRGGSGQLTLSGRDIRVLTGEADAVVHLSAGESACYAVQHAPLGQPLPRALGQAEMTAALSDTVAGWQGWSRLHQSYEGPWQDLVHHSGRVLEALSYQPTGAIVAAATTSLPEWVGGRRNWDYRYSWIRDASLTMEALWIAACPDEAHEFFDFLTAAAADARPAHPVQIMFGVGGERDLTERSLPHLSGWRHSAPVRVGNNAWSQVQIDVYGELLGAAHRLKRQLGPLSSETREFLVDLADAAARDWKKPDNGIWEVRGEPRHFVHSKLMCWVALDRAVSLAATLDAEDRVARWSTTADVIRESILDEGWNAEVHAFTQCFGTRDLDSSVLLMPVVGLISATDPRILSTIDTIARRLTDSNGLVYRYRIESGVDGVDGEEGTFLLCTFWLAQALALAGRVDEAREVFERAAGRVNDIGLLSEEIDPASNGQLGNFPQAFSHIGLINAAWAIHRAEQSRFTEEVSHDDDIDDGSCHAYVKEV
ncbi:glycoside hydrolase family 15 protein [Streptomyces sp. Lzd4kr]|nr:glycoside hydrolase family 15 protein [Streptomyces sp. Lzd4kr]